MSEQSKNKDRTISEQSKIHIVLRKEQKWGRTLYYTTKK